MIRQRARRPPRRVIKLTHPSYQPSKAEVEEVLPPLAEQFPGVTSEDMVRAFVASVEVRYVRRRQPCARK